MVEILFSVLRQHSLSPFHVQALCLKPCCITVFNPHHYPFISPCYNKEAEALERWSNCLRSHDWAWDFFPTVVKYIQCETYRLTWNLPSLSVYLSGLNTFTLLYNHHHYPSPGLFIFSQTETLYPLKCKPSFPASSRTLWQPSSHPLSLMSLLPRQPSKWNCYSICLAYFWLASFI